MKKLDIRHSVVLKTVAFLLVIFMAWTCAACAVGIVIMFDSEVYTKSESTISRAAASKYVRTPHGVFPFKYFFTAGYVSDEGNEVSRTADMELLKKLVDEEDKKHPLSDDKLSQLLNKAGHPVARRTVAKYRDIMNIPSSSLRKEHF